MPADPEISRFSNTAVGGSEIRNKGRWVGLDPLKSSKLLLEDGMGGWTDLVSLRLGI